MHEIVDVPAIRELMRHELRHGKGAELDESPVLLVRLLMLDRWLRVFEVQ